MNNSSGFFKITSICNMFRHHGGRDDRFAFSGVYRGHNTPAHPNQNRRRVGGGGGEEVNEKERLKPMSKPHINQHQHHRPMVSFSLAFHLHS